MNRLLLVLLVGISGIVLVAQKHKFQTHKKSQDFDSRSNDLIPEVIKKHVSSNKTHLSTSLGINVIHSGSNLFSVSTLC